MRLTTDMMKGKMVPRLLVAFLAAGMALSPFPVMERAQASSVSSVWVELSHATYLNLIDTALEYIIHFTTTTALTGGVDTITVAFPDGTTAMAGEEGSGYAFTLPSSIAATYVAVDPDGALTTTIGYTDCYTAPDVGSYRVRLKVPEDIAAGASPYIKFETGADIHSASQAKTVAGALCHYQVKVETSQDTTPVYSNYFYLGSTAVTSVGHLSGYPTPDTVGSAAEYKFEFTVGASGALTAGSGTITVIFPSGTTVPAAASKQQVQVDADGSGTSYSLTACDVNPTCHPDSRTVTLIVPQAVANHASVYVYFRNGFGLVNPTTSTSTARVKIYTSAEPKYTVAANTLQGIWGSSGEVFAVGYYDDDTMRHYSDSTWSSEASGTSNNLYGVWGTSISNVYAVGHNGTIVHYDGSSWSSTTSGTNNLYGVWGTTSSNIYAVGYGGTILHYSDSSWSSLTSGTTNNLYGVWGYDATHVYAVGYGGTILYSTGGATPSWSSLTSGTTNNLYGVWGSSATDVFAVGASGIILHSADGSSWSSQVSSTSNNLYGVWGSGVNDVYAVGASGTILRSTDSGTTWESLDSNTTNGYAIAAGTATKLGFANSSGAYSDDATMVNMYSSTIYLQLQDHYGNIKAPGSDLTASLSSTSGTGKFYSAAGSQISSATIYDGTGDPVGTTAGQFSFLYKDSVAGTHTITASAGSYTSASWTVTVAPAVSVYDTNNNLVNTYAPTSTSPVAEGSGYHGGDYLQNAISDALPGEKVKLGDGIYEVDTGITMGKAITLQSVNGASSTTLRPTTNDLYSVWEYSGSDVFAVGACGTIVHYNGTAWSSMTSGTTNTLYGLWGSSSTNVFAVGASGTILKYDGTNWSSLTSGTTNNLYGVWGYSGSDVFAVGYGGTIVHYNGTAWSSQTSGITDTLYGVWGYSGSDVFAVGASGTILHYSSSWSSQTSGTTNTLYGVWEYSASNAFAVGICGTILKYNGTSWSSMTSPTTTLDQAITITATGSSTYGVTINGITFNRLRSGTVFNYAIYDQTADYITVQNCVFNYIYNRGVMLTSTNAAFTNGTISNNTFTNGGGDPPASTDAAIDVTATASYAISGITISGNTITNQKGKGIYLAGNSTYTVSSVSITSNTITTATSYGIQGYTYANTIAITSNTITGCYEDGIDVKGTAYTIKKNVVTDNLGDGIDMELTSASHLINYNDIYNNTGYGVNVRSSVSTVNAKYNWWGNASGPTYTAATGASVDVSNPGGTGDNITDRVTYYEWLYKPKADVIADNAAYYSRTISLSVGWNTLSTPIILDASTDTVDEVVDPAKMTIAYWYDTNDADSDGTYWEQVTTGYELEPCDAIYIKMNAADTVLLKYNATDLSTPTKALYDGWNLIGLANLESKHVDDAVQSVANTPTNLPGYSQVISPSMNSSDWTYSSGQSYTDEDMLVGEGYWIYMQNDCTLAGFTITPIQPSLD